MARAALVVLVILALVAPVYAGEQASEKSLTGVYACEGTNPDGGIYSGIVEIVSIKDTYLVRWTMPNDSQVVGVGILSGDQLSVSYYGGTPALVVYSIAENGQAELASGPPAELKACCSRKRSPDCPKERLRPATPAKPSKPTNRESDAGPKVTV